MDNPWWFMRTLGVSFGREECLYCLYSKITVKWTMKRLRTSLMVVMMAGITACASTTTSLMSGMSLSDEPLTGKFIWHDLMTTDLEADKRFYSGLFGWTYEQRRGPNGKPYTLAKSGDRFVAGMVVEQRPKDGSDISRWLGYLSIPDVGLAIKKNGAAGGSTVVEQLEISDFVRVAAIIDPQGAVLGLAQSSIGDPDDSDAGKSGRVVWDELLASDTVTAARFYKELAGYKVDVQQRNGGEYTLLIADGVKRAGILKNPLDGVEPLWLTYFGVQDVMETTAKVSALGGRVLLSPAADIRHGKLALVVGPSGALLALQQLPL
jgi:predicted enzyme related to lactoylglutathione lyase